MCSLVMSLFSHDYIKTDLSISNVLTYVLTSVQYSYGAWFLDGRTSILVLAHWHVASLAQATSYLALHINL